MDNAELEALVDKALSEHPEVFPSSQQIAELLKKYGASIHATTVWRNLERSELQINWIKSCSDKIFLENFHKKALNQLDETCMEAIKKRFKGIIKAELKAHPEVFPSSCQIKELLKNEYGVRTGLSTILDKIDIPNLKFDWITSRSEKAFLENISKGISRGLDEKCREAAKRRFEGIVKAELEEHPEVFPGSYQIVDLLKKHGVSINAGTVLRNLDLSERQLNWINSCPKKVFLENFSKKIFSGLDEKCREAAKKRFEEIVRAELKKHPDVFPSSNEIAKLLKKYGVNTHAVTILKNLKLSELQIKWINSSSENTFLKILSKHELSALDKSCIEAVDKRMHNIFLSNIDNLDNLLISTLTVKRYLQKLPDLAFLLATAQEHKHTIDQRIILAMHVWKETRSEELRELISERLEQLWGFRELFALMKDGRCLDADVISMFHESMPERIAGYVPDAAIRHSFVDGLRDGSFRAGAGKDVLLLSFMHWLTDKQAAGILLRLNRAVGADNTIFMTSPNGLEYSSELIRLLSDFGFTPEKIGTLYLLPPDAADGQEHRKLLTKSKILQFRKMKDIETVHENAELFSEERDKGGGERPEPKTEIISYDKDMLKRAMPLISMREVASVFVEEIPEVKKVETNMDAALLELKGGTVVGFNVDKKHPYSIEIEGTRIPKGTDNAVLDVMNGKDGFKVSTRMKEEYRKFLDLIRKRREKICEVKKTVLKKQKRDRAQAT